MTSRLAPLALLLAAACEQPAAARTGATAVAQLAAPGGLAAVAAPVTAYSPDVPTWRGGCFSAGAPGKIVNGSPSPDVRFFGTACGATPGPGGLVYLDHYDPVSGTGDVTVLSAAPGSAPVVIGPAGGAGGIVDGSTGARFDDAQTKVLTLANVGFVTGQLVQAELPGGAPVTTIAGGVRVENYDFLPGGAILYVGNYDATKRSGDLVYWSGTPQTLATGASRFDFNMYRLGPARDRVAYLTGYTDANGGALFVQPLPPPAVAPAPLVPSGVYRMTWTADGHLVYRVRNADGVTFALYAWDGSAAPVQLAALVNSAEVVGNSVVYASGWNVLSQQATLHLVPAAGGADQLGASPVSLSLGAAQPPGAGGTLPPGGLAYVSLPSTADPFTGNLLVAPVPGGPGAQVDTGVSPAGGFWFGPLARGVAYARDFQQPRAAGSASPQPGIAAELKVAPVAGGTPFLLASAASMQWIAWEPSERFVAGLGNFAPAAGSGDLVAADASTGARLLAMPGQRVGGFWFDFGTDGQALAAIRGWDDALLRGELVLAPTSGAGAWIPVAIDQDVTFYLRPAGGRIIYGVRGGGHDGLWLGALP